MDTKLTRTCMWTWCILVGILGPLTANEFTSEISHITNAVATLEPPFCPSRVEDFNNWNHSLFLTDLVLSYNKDTAQYSSLPNDQKTLRIVDDSDTSWVNYLCPEVVEYFSVVKYNDFYDKYSLLKKKRGRRQSNDVSMTTAAAMASTCMLRVVDIVAKDLNISWALIAGSHLGAGLHGGPIPWDDDTDIIIDINKKESFIEAIQSFQFENRSLFEIYQGSNALKMWIAHHSYTPLFSPNSTSYLIRYPYLDIFSFRRNQVVETGRRGLARKTWEANIFDRIRLYFFGGLMLPGLPWAAADLHYNTSQCIVAHNSHRGRYFTYNRNHGQVFCCQLTIFYPFLYRIPSRSNPLNELEVVVLNRRPLHVTRVNSATGQVMEHGYLRSGDSQLGSHLKSKDNFFQTRELFRSQKSGLQQWLPRSAWRSDFAARTWGQFSTPARRADILVAAARGGRRQGRDFTAQIPDLDTVEVDNTIAASGNCRLLVPASEQRVRGGPGRRELKVVTFNARRGSSWLDFVFKVRSDPALQNPDVILLSEMDIGMSRSGNLHTTRMMAYALGMNYAWGLEFVELTSGNKDEQEQTRGKTDTLALHGNAILAACPLRDAFVLRSSFNEKYISSTASFVNAYGFEKRLGGRMGVFAHIHVPHAKSSSAHVQGLPLKLLLGSIHKIQAENYDEMIRRIGAVGVVGSVISGDQVSSTCAAVGLHHLDDSRDLTFPMTCSGGGSVPPGTQHGDIICSDLPPLDQFARPSHIVQPCLFFRNASISLSDHAIYVAVVAV